MSISYDPLSHSFTGIDPDWLARCREAYPHINLELVMKQLSLWLDVDWPKRAKKNYQRFLTNNFASAELKMAIKSSNTRLHPELRPPLKRPKLEDEVPRKEMQEFIKQLADMKGMK